MAEEDGGRLSDRKRVTPGGLGDRRRDERGGKREEGKERRGGCLSRCTVG